MTTGYEGLPGDGRRQHGPDDAEPIARRHPRGDRHCIRVGRAIARIERRGPPVRRARKCTCPSSTATPSTPCGSRSPCRLGQAASTRACTRRRSSTTSIRCCPAAWSRCRGRSRNDDVGDPVAIARGRRRRDRRTGRVGAVRNGDPSYPVWVGIATIVGWDSSSSSRAPRCGEVDGARGDWRMRSIRAWWSKGDAFFGFLANRRDPAVAPGVGCAERDRDGSRGGLRRSVRARLRNAVRRRRRPVVPAHFRARACRLTSVDYVMLLPLGRALSPKGPHSATTTRSPTRAPRARCITSSPARPSRIVTCSSTRHRPGRRHRCDPCQTRPRRPRLPRPVPDHVGPDAAIDDHSVVRHATGGDVIEHCIRGGRVDAHDRRRDRLDGRGVRVGVQQPLCDRYEHGSGPSRRVG